MQQDTLRDFLKFFRFHLPWFVLSAGFFAVILITGLYVSSKIPSADRPLETQNQQELALGVPSVEEPSLVVQEPTTPDVPEQPIAPNDTDLPKDSADSTLNTLPSPVATIVPTPVPAVPKDFSSPSKAAAETTSYTVEKGDTLWDISVKTYGTGYDYSRISRFNKIDNPSQITIGQVLQLPKQTGEIASGVSIDHGDQSGIEQIGSYNIVKGDSLWKIAERELGDPYRWVEIYQLNKAVIGSNPDLIYPDVTLVLPDNKSSSSSSSQITPSNWTSTLLQ